MKDQQPNAEQEKLRESLLEELRYMGRKARAKHEDVLLSNTRTRDLFGAFDLPISERMDVMLAYPGDTILVAKPLSQMRRVEDLEAIARSAWAGVSMAATQYTPGETKLFLVKE